MEIIEEIARRRQEIVVENPGRAYSEIRDLLENRLSFDEVFEEKYFNDVDEGRIRTKVMLIEGQDKFTEEIIELYLSIDKETGKAEIQMKGKLETEYPTEKNYQQSLWYYAYRSLFDKFIYGETRGGYEEAVEHDLDHILRLVRENLEEDFNG
ncbi:hypothetical protein ACK3SF_00035 [Candidatus Nanosalina sp. VS9-1]|uniref:hypothetical protein n=1 Tax=Candidatus Nanosalina sp. VS9-1 TaxID=3388566 RepID=UPI0039DFC759